MAEVNIAELTDSIVLHFETPNRRINAYTLASTLVALADAAKAANSSLNPGFDVEIVVEALGPGSFRAQFKAIFTSAKNLWSQETLRTIVLAVLANFIYERTLAVKDRVTVEMHTNEVIIVHGSDRIIVPRCVYDATRTAEQNPQFVRAIGRSFDAIGADEKISGIGFVTTMTSPPPELLIRQSAIRDAMIEPLDMSDTRTISEQCDLQIVKAILDRTNRKWEFIWRGVRISAPVLDESFYDKFFAHEITIAPGDVLTVHLAIKQTLDPTIGVYTNAGYEVTRVFRHVPQLRQASFAARADEQPPDHPNSASAKGSK